MAASLGLTPREHSSGRKQRLLGIGKCGDTYLRTLLIHGARTVLRHAKNKTDRLLAVGPGAEGTAREECRRGGAGQQTRSHRLDGAGAGTDLSARLAGPYEHPTRPLTPIHHELPAYRLRR